MTEAAIDLTKMKGQTVAVWGLGVTGSSVVRACQRSGVRCFGWDDNEERRESASQPKVPLLDLSQHANWQVPFDTLVISPGVPPDHSVYELAKIHDKTIVSDVDLFWRHCKGAQFIGVTGTNGKSTTAALIHHILHHAGIPVCLGGNIGKAVLDLPKMGDDGCYVIEMSSFQLQHVQEIKFDIAVLLNLAPDHLEYHKSFINYRRAKMNIVARQGKDNTFIVATDHVTVLDCAIEVVEQDRVVVPIGKQDLMPGGYGWIGDVLYSAHKSEPQPMLFADMVAHLPGVHNRQNIAAAVAVARVLDIPIAQIQSGIKSFKGLKHRLQPIAVIDNIQFYNDSKATNVAAATRAVQTFARCYWIVGGRAKQDDDWNAIKNKLESVVEAFLIGEAAPMIQSVFGTVIPCHRCDSLEDATAKAYETAVNYQNSDEPAVICLSPGCASFDMYADYAARGDAFIAAVNALSVAATNDDPTGTPR